MPTSSTLFTAIKKRDHLVNLKILDILAEKKTRTVTELYIELRIEQSVASQFLKGLREAGLVKKQRHGKFMLYERDEKALELLHDLENNWTKRGDDTLDVRKKAA